MTDYPEILVDVTSDVMTVTLNRPAKRNAMNRQLVDELMSVFKGIHAGGGVRALVLRGAGGNFCAGGDISGMNKDTGGNPAIAKKAAWQFNRDFGHMCTLANRLPVVVITLLEGAVLGGGLGLACISDVAIADRNAKLGMPETGLGIIPAQIAPFVVARVGLPTARRLALLGDWLDGAAAKAVGIAHYVTDGEAEMQATLDKVLIRVKRTAPHATALTKKLLQEVPISEHEALLDRAADYFASAAASAEGREGTSAFVEKRLPAWAED